MAAISLKIILIYILFISFNAKILAVDEVIQLDKINSGQTDEKSDKKTDTKEEQKIRDFFTDNDGNMLEQHEIPSLKHQIGERKILTIFKNNRKACYAISYPFIQIGNHQDDRNAYLMVIYLNKAKQILNISTGYSLRKGPTMDTSIDGVQYHLNVTNEMVVVPNNSTIIAQKMLYGQKMLIKGISVTGTYTVDAYDLTDFKNVYLKLVELCE